MTLILLAWVCASVAAAAEPESSVDLARKAIQAGEPERAVSILKGSVADDPRTRSELATALLAAGEVDEAFRTVGEKPTVPEGVRVLALVRALRGETEEALRLLEGPKLLTTRGRVLWRIFKTRSAIESLERAGDAEAKNLLGRIYLYKGWESEGAFPGWHEEPQYREQAIVAFLAAAAASPDWFEPRLGLGQAFLYAGKPTEALAELDAAIERAPKTTGPRVGRFQALKLLGRLDAVRTEVAAAAGSEDPRLLEAARQGLALLGDEPGARAIAARLIEKFSSSEGAETATAARIDAARKTKDTGVVLAESKAYLARYPYGARRVAVYDALLEAYQATPSTPPEELIAAIDGRLRSRPDPGAYVAGASLLASRGVLFDRVVQLAEASVPLAEAFIDENRGAYKLSDKARGSLNRSRAAAIDLIGWVSFLKKDLKAAEAKLTESERLSRGQDFVNQFHLGELCRARGDAARASEYYLSALSLSAGPEPVRASARKALAALRGEDVSTFEAFLAAELARRQEVRRALAVRSLVDQPAPSIPMTDLSGKAIDIAALRGKVLLLNFFASW